MVGMFTFCDILGQPQNLDIDATKDRVLATNCSRLWSDFSPGVTCTLGNTLSMASLQAVDVGVETYVRI